MDTSHARNRESIRTVRAQGSHHLEGSACRNESQSRDALDEKRASKADVVAVRLRKPNTFERQWGARSATGPVASTRSAFSWNSLGGGCRHSLHAGDDAKHPLELMHHARRRNPHDAIPPPLEPPRTPSISLHAQRMITPIHLDHQASTRSEKIHDERPERHLPPERDPEPPTANGLPGRMCSLGVGCRPTHARHAACAKRSPVTSTGRWEQ